MVYADMLKHYFSNCQPCLNEYSSLGQAFFGENEEYRGEFWVYETDEFILDIQDVYIKQNYYIESELASHDKFLASNYIIKGRGAFLAPYEEIGDNSVFVIDTAEKLKTCVFYANNRYLSVGLKFTQEMVNKLLQKEHELQEINLGQAFTLTGDKVTLELYKLSQEIMACRLDGLAARLFFQAKANEWLCCIVSAFANLAKPPISSDEKLTASMVASYIEHNYNSEILQEFLCKIAACSPTRLKTLFKRVYHMSISEYIQRQRMQAAQHLLLNTNMSIKQIALAVGYKSPSRFSTLFKRYKHIYAKDLRSQTYVKKD